MKCEDTKSNSCHFNQIILLWRERIRHWYTFVKGIWDMLSLLLLSSGSFIGQCNRVYYGRKVLQLLDEYCRSRRARLMGG